MYPHKSGSQKRKERASRKEAFSKAQKAQRTLAAFNFQQNTSTSSTIPASDKNSSPGQPEELENSSTQSVSDNIQDEPRNTSFSSQFSDGKNVELDNHENDDTSEEKFVTSVKYDTNKKLDSKLVDKHSYDYDIGTLKAEFLQPEEVQEVLRRGHSKMPSTFPRDRLGEPFPLSLLSTILPNGEKIQRDWLVWSQTKSAFYCLPCRLFSKNTLNRSKMCSPEGYSAECCAQAITFFGVVQKCYNIFSSSTQRWEILKSNIPDSLHSLSDTRWAARIDGVKPFAKNLPGLRKSLEEIKKLNLTAETLRDVNGILKYMSTFECVLMASIWFKILQAINERNLVLQEMNATIDVEVDNLRSLLADLQLLRDLWSGIYNECKIVADNFIDTSSILRPARKKKRVDSSHDIVNEDCTIEEIDFKRNTFFVIIDSIMSGISRRFQAINELNETFSFLWQFSDTNIQECQTAAEKFAVKYPADVSQNLSNEIIHLKNIYEANFGPQLPPFDLLNAIYAKKLNRLFPNVCIALRIFCTIPVSVASGERSFSVLARIKNFHRSCSTQTRVSSLATLCLEAQLARELDFEELINSFASAKARKAHL